MAHWFHRNQLKATTALSFDFGPKAASSLARNICIDTKLARAALLNILPDPNKDVDELTTKFEAYIGLLLGFVNPTEAPSGHQPPPQSQPKPEAQDQENPTESEGDSTEIASSGHQLSTLDSKLRNALKITWTNSLTSKTVNQHDFVFELISILFNTALWYTKHAAKVAASTENIAEDDAKEVHRCLRTAAGIFSYIQNHLVVRLFEKHEDAIDMDPQVLLAYILQCTAEAQEVTVARAIELKHKPTLISALANETYNLFRKASDALRSVDETIVNKWRKYLLLKSAIYLSYAHSYNGLHLVDNDKCGEAIRSLRESVTLHQKAGILCSEYAAAKGTGVAAKPEHHPFYRRLGTTVKRILDKCERENGFIYHQKIPDNLPELESHASFGLATPIEFELPAKSTDWTWEVYNGFSLSAQNHDKKKKEKEEPVKPVKEVPISQTDKEPNNSSGCVIS
ncbi:BRO1 domain-containing protein BROX-like [Apostichopus japonicus]|uniref:BRO1 domain-containing protein BROX-like n=1 Tax=Stichopus japonicus TaxID=307972 RepID=UPI003AB667CD